MRPQGSCAPTSGGQDTWGRGSGGPPPGALPPLTCLPHPSLPPALLMPGTCANKHTPHTLHPPSLPNIQSPLTPQHTEAPFNRLLTFKTIYKSLWFCVPEWGAIGWWHLVARGQGQAASTLALGPFPCRSRGHNDCSRCGDYPGATAAGAPVVWQLPLQPAESRVSRAIVQFWCLSRHL